MIKKKYNLWPHQKYAVELYSKLPFFGLLFACGLGKTLTAIRIAEKKKRPVLIIAPNALCNQWKDEFADKGEEEWETFVVTTKEKKRKNFAEELDRFIKL